MAFYMECYDHVTQEHIKYVVSPSIKKSKIISVFYSIIINGELSQKIRFDGRDEKPSI